MHAALPQRSLRSLAPWAKAQLPSTWSWARGSYSANFVQLLRLTTTQDIIWAPCSIPMYPRPGNRLQGPAVLALKVSFLLLGPVAPHTISTRDTTQPISSMINSCTGLQTAEGHDICPDCWASSPLMQVKQSRHLQGRLRLLLVAANCHHVC